MNINFPGGSMTAAAPPWSEMVKYDLNTGEIVWRIPTGVQEAPPEYNIPNNTGVQFPRNAPLVTAGGLIFLATGPERKMHAYDRDNGKELWQHSLPNGAEGMPATYQVNGRQFVVLSVAQATGTFPATFGNAGAAPAAEPVAVKAGAADRSCRARTSRSPCRNSPHAPRSRRSSDRPQSWYLLIRTRNCRGRDAEGRATTNTSVPRASRRGALSSERLYTDALFRRLA